MAIAGLSVVGRDKYGVFPLKGKILNVKDAAVSKSVTGLENHWNNSARQNYERAKSLAEQALAATK
jgi:DNA gyrase/topoisomerase IV subunit B